VFRLLFVADCSFCGRLVESMRTCLAWTALYPQRIIPTSELLFYCDARSLLCFVASFLLWLLTEYAGLARLFIAHLLGKSNRTTLTAELFSGSRLVVLSC